jgi:hypothetical protein
MTRSLLVMVDRLAELRVTRVVMEATSEYWKPVFYLLEAHGFETWVVNARDVKEPELNNLFYTGHDSVVPVTVKKVPGEGYRFFLVVGEFDFCGVEVGVEFATDG